MTVSYVTTYNSNEGGHDSKNSYSDTIYFA